MIMSIFKKIWEPLVFIYLIGFSLTFTELLFNLSGKSLCQTEGCRIVESFVKGGEIVLLVSGLVLFGVLLLFAITKKLQIFHSVLLIGALSIEGYLLGFQSFIIKEFCLFCIVVFAILLISAIMRFIKGRKELAFAFISLLAVFFITYLVNPKINDFPSSRYLLIYSKNCPNCNEIILYCEQMSIPIHKMEAKEVLGILKALKINSVPVLFCDEGTEKNFIIGSEKIKEYLMANVVPKKEETGVCPIFSPVECK